MRLLEFWPTYFAFAVLAGSYQPTIRAADPQSEQVSPHLLALVTALGDDKFSSRENATEELISAGISALPALQQGTRHSDREIRFRSYRIILLVRKNDFQRRLDSFSKEYDSDSEYDLPGWDEYRQLMGDEPEARSLFVHMQRSESELIAGVMSNKKSAGDLLTFRTMQIQNSMRTYRTQLTLGSVATMVFIAGDEDVSLGQQANSAINSFCYQASFQTAMQNSSTKPIVRKLLGAWIKRGEDWTAYQGLSLAMRYNLKEGLVPAERILNNPVAQTHVMQYAILTVAKLGNKDYMSLLEKFLDDKTRVSTRRVDKLTYETQMRDVALAGLVHLAEQDHKKFGFSQIQKHTTVLFSTSTLGFKDEKERQVALTKWKEFRAAEK